MTKKEAKKAKRITILGVLGLLLVAAICFIVGFGISEGWAAVGAWFTSKWATLTVVAVSLLSLVLVTLYFNLRDKEGLK